MSTRQACDYLGITIRTLYRAIDDGSIRATRVGRAWRRRIEDIEAYLERAQVQPGTLAHLYPPLKRSDG